MPRRERGRGNNERLVNMEYYEGKLCVSYDDLTAGENPIISYSALKKAISRKRVERAQRGGGEDTCCLIYFASLSRKHREAWIARYGDPEAEMKRAKAEADARLVLDVEARAFYESFEQTLNGVRRGLTPDLIASYTIKASALGLLLSEDCTRVRVGSVAGCPMKMDERNRIMVERAMELMQANKEARERGEAVAELKLPKSKERLRKALEAYRREGYGSVVSARTGNTNKTKLTTEGISYIIALRRSRVPVHSTRSIFEMYNERAKKEGWKVLSSERTITNLLEKPEVKQQWYDARMGEMAAHQRFDRKHVTELPRLRDALWYGDGTKLNLYYRDDAGNVRTTQVYEVVDAYSECLLGYHISDTEDFWAQYHAFRMAVIKSGHQPYEIVHDNQGGHKKLDNQKFFSKIARRHRPTAPYNGQSKTIENIFGRFQAQVLARRENFTGMNVTTKSERSKPNLEFIEANKHRLPTLAELKEDYAEARREWNAMAHPATGIPREQMYNESVNPETQPVGKYEMIDMFWVMTERPTMFTARGLTVQIKGKKYHYEVLTSDGLPDFEWRRVNTERKFFVQYDPTDMTSVRLYYKDEAGGLHFSAIGRPPITVHRAWQEQSEEDKAFLRAMQEAGARERVERQLRGKEHEFANGTAPEQHGYLTPRQKGLDKEHQRQVDRRIRRLEQDYGTTTLHPYKRSVALGKATKETSNLTFDMINGSEVRVVKAQIIHPSSPELTIEERKMRAISKL